MPQLYRQHIYPSIDDLVEHASRAILRAAEQAISARGTFHLVLAGGSTPKVVYQRLAKADANWQQWFIYLGDERCVPKGDPERNDQMAAESWLNHVAIPELQIFPIPGEQGAIKGAESYNQIVRNVELFDLTLLGLGEDGHTASLFPNHELGEATDAPDCLTIRNAPKLPPSRISLSAQRLSRSRQVLFFVTGEGKQEAVKRWLNQGDIPACAITPAAGVDILLDQAARE